MFCKNCGKELPNGTKFCPHCGTNLAAGQPAAAMQPAQQTPVTPVQPVQQPGAAVQPQPVKKSSGVKTLIIILAIVAVVVVIAAAILLAVLLHKPTIDLNKYVSVSFEGYDTIGEAAVVLDYEALEEDYGRKLGETYDFVGDCIVCYLDAWSGLSNGDTVTLTWDCDEEEALETYGVKLKYEAETYTVEGLEEAETFDPFSGVEVTFDGIAPDGNAYYTVNSDDEAVWNYTYSFDQSSGLSNGDTVTLTVSMGYDDIVEYTIRNYGKIPSPLEKTYTVEGLPAYMGSLSEIPEDQLELMKQKAEEVFMNYVDETFDESERLDAFTYLGNIFVTMKEGYMNYEGMENRIYLVYRASINDYYENDGQVFDENVYLYWYFSCDNLMTDTDGSFQADLENYRTPENTYTRIYVNSGISSGWWSTKDWFYFGYASYQELYQELVTDNAESRNAESTVDDSTADAAVTTASNDEASDYLCEYSSDRELTESEVEAYLAADYSDYNFPGGRNIIQMLINEMYARHGYRFSDEELTEYFNQKGWYALLGHQTDNMDDVYQGMSEIEKYNIELLEKYKDR